MQIEHCFRDWKSHLGLRGLHLEVHKSEGLLRLLMGFTLAYLIVLLLGQDPLAQRLRLFSNRRAAAPATAPRRRSAHSRWLCRTPAPGSRREHAWPRFSPASRTVEL